MSKMNGLVNEISNLINSKKEGDYWDFKEVPHDNNAALLHDILCLANCAHSGSRYIIYGITDPSDGCKLIGLTDGQLNRKTQTGFIDLLRSKKIAGDLRPGLELQVIKLGQSEIDVLVIANRPFKPYYLLESYRVKDKEVRAYHIYTRTGDSNTPIDSSADIHFVEQMWRQRFGLDLQPAVRMELLLAEPENWNKDIGNQSTQFHLTSPEYKIKFSQPERFDEVFSYFFTNEKSFLGKAVFKYNTTKLFELEYMYCDEMRIVLSVPENGYFRVGAQEEWYYFYDLSQQNGRFLEFLCDHKLDFRSRGFGAPFLIFNNEADRKIFEASAIENWEKINALEAGFPGTHALKRIKQANKSYMTDPLFLDRIHQFYVEWSNFQLINYFNAT